MCMQPAIVDFLAHKDAMNDRKFLVSKISVPCLFVVHHGFFTAWAHPYICFSAEEWDGVECSEEQDHPTLLVHHSAHRTRRLTKATSIVYNDLAHPPGTSISNKYAWRTADGSYNNIDMPDLGKVRLSQLQLFMACSAVFFRLVHLIPDQFNKPTHYPKINSPILVSCLTRELQIYLCSI